MHYFAIIYITRCHTHYAMPLMPALLRQDAAMLLLMLSIISLAKRAPPLVADTPSAAAEPY